MKVQVRMRAYASMYRPFRRIAISGHTRLIAGYKKAKTYHTISDVEIVMLEKLDCHISKRATRPIYMRVQVRLNAISPYQSQQSSPAIRDTSAPAIQDISALAIQDISTPALQDSSPAETCICNTPPSCYALWSKKQTNKQTNKQT